MSFAFRSLAVWFVAAAAMSTGPLPVGAEPAGSAGARQTPASDVLRARRPVAVPSFDERLARLLRWRGAVDRQTGVGTPLDGPDLSDWTRDDIRGVVADLGQLVAWMAAQRENPARALARLPTDGRLAHGLTLRTLDEANALLKRGALAHATVAILAADRPAESPRRFASDEGVVVIIRDGQQVGISASQIHWEAGRALIAGLQPAPAAVPGVREWYRATAAYLHYHYFLGDLDPHLDEAIRLFPDDAYVHLQRGALHETYASARVQSTRASTVVPRGRRSVVRARRDHLEQANRDFRRALDLDPTLAEARLRLGRVSADLGRHHEAIPLLEAAEQALDDPALRYFCALFVAASYAARGDHDAARRAYERAASRFPAAQSPLLGLASLQWQTGQRHEAMASLRRLVALPRDETARDDPWWLYTASHVRAVVDDLEAMREAMLAAAPAAR